VAAQAIYLTQLGEMLDWTVPPPWVEDLDVLWIRLGPEPVDQPLGVWLANVPGTSGYIHALTLDATNAPSAAVPGHPGEVRDVSQLLASLASDLVDFARAATEVQGALAAALPADAEALAAELTVQATERFRSAKTGLTDAQRERMARRESISARELAAEVRENLRQAVALLWARDVCAQIAQPPPWAADPQSSRLEFGLFPQEPRLGDAAGRKYVKIWPPEGHDTFQTGIWA
jgi:hypothetical protein